MPTTNRHGGARPGAGRKPGPATRISVPGRVSERAQKIARAIGGDALTGLLEEYATRNRLHLPEHEPIGVVTCPRCQGDARGPVCLCRGAGVVEVYDDPDAELPADPSLDDAAQAMVRRYRASS